MISADQLQYAPYLKLERAKHHISNLNERIDEFLTEKPFKLMIQFRAGAGEVAMRTEVEKSIPPEFSLIIGDAIHNMRSALDVTLYTMASEKTCYPNKIQFPIAKDFRKLESAIKDGQVMFAGEKVVEAVRLLRPYQTGNWRLAGLHSLDILDKHRLLILSRSIPTFITGKHNTALIEMFLGIRGFPDGIPINLIAPEDGDLVKVKLEGTNLPNTESEAADQPNFVISFGDEQPFANKPVIETLLKCEAETRLAIDAMIAAYLSQT